MREGAHRVDVVVVAHEDERPGVHRAGGERAHPLALVRVDVDPTLFERAPAHDFHVILAKRGDPLSDPLHRFLVWHLEQLGPQLRARVIRLQHLESQCMPSNAPVPMPRPDVVPKCSHHVVEDLDRDVARLERSFQRRRVAACAGEEHIALDAPGQARRHRVLHPQMLIRVALECGTTDLAIRVGHERADRALGDLVQLAVRTHRRRKLEVGVGEHAVDRQRAGERIRHLGEELLHLCAADAFLQLLEAVEVVVEVGQAWRACHPFAQFRDAYLEHLGNREGGGGAELGRDRPGSVRAGGGILVGHVDRVGHRAVDHHLGHQAMRALVGFEPVGKSLGRVAEAALELLEVGEAGEDGVDRKLPPRMVRKHAIGVPRKALIDLGPCGERFGHGPISSMIPMPRATANGIEIEYETFGDPQAPAVLLVAGLGAQMLSWDDDFCALLAGRGFRVIRYDNRDSGLSTWVEDAYTLDDMADDAAGLLDALCIAAAHVVGASMGGFIAQLLTLNHPGRVLTLTSIMSGPNGDDQVQPTAEGSAVLMAPAPPTREERIALGLWAKQKLLGPADPFDEPYERARITRAVDRAYHPAGFGRQLGAILVAKGRLERLGSVGVSSRAAGSRRCRRRSLDCRCCTASRRPTASSHSWTPSTARQARRRIRRISLPSTRAATPVW